MYTLKCPLCHEMFGNDYILAAHIKAVHGGSSNTTKNYDTAMTGSGSLSIGVCPTQRLYTHAEVQSISRFLRRIRKNRHKKKL